LMSALAAVSLPYFFLSSATTFSIVGWELAAGCGADWALIFSANFSQEAALIPNAALAFLKLSYFDFSSATVTDPDWVGLGWVVVGTGI